MSTEHHKTGQTGDQPPANADVAFESQDIDTRTILSYLFYLALSVAAAFIASVFIFKFTSKMAADSDTPMAPVHRGVGATMPPEPMLSAAAAGLPRPTFAPFGKTIRPSSRNDRGTCDNSVSKP